MDFIMFVVMIPIFYMIFSILAYVYMGPSLFFNRRLIKSFRKTKHSFYN